MDRSGGGAQLYCIDNDHRLLFSREVIQEREASDTGKLNPGARRKIHCQETSVHLISNGVVCDEFVPHTDDQCGGAPRIVYWIWTLVRHCCPNSVISDFTGLLISSLTTPSK